MMNQMENKYSLFEAELRRNTDDTMVDYRAVESSLFSRIADAEYLDELAVLKLDEVLSADTFGRIESKLFSQIIQYNEYDIPMNECIRTHYDLAQGQWDRLESKIEASMHSCESLPVWELYIKAPEVLPTTGEWETLEDSLFDRIGEISECELWEQAAHLDKMHIQDSLDTVEKILDERIRERESLEKWEFVLKSEEMIPFAKWENIESSLFEKIESGSDQRPLLLKDQPFWHILNNYVLTLRTLKGAVTAMLLILIALGGYFSERLFSTSVPTLVYQLQGSATEGVKANSLIEHKVLNSVQGGSVSFVNEHGLVELQNGSKVHVDKMTRHHVRYKVGFGNNVSGNDVARGQVAFLVNPLKHNESFKVVTPDYEISVRGTYFKVEPDLGGRMVTRVLEGKVRVSSPLFGDTLLQAGQAIVYDIFTDTYRIQSGGAVVLRKDLEIVPDIDALKEYKIISIKSNVFDAEVRIDGHYLGTAPLSVRQAPGVHHIRLGKTGYVMKDTSITIGTEDSEFTVALHEIKQPQTAPAVANEVPVVTKKMIVSPEIVASVLLGDDEVVQKVEKPDFDSLYSLAQKVESKGNWKDAIVMYQKIFDNPDVSRLRKEDALFSIAKLRADNEDNKAGAKNVFMTYLALYPNGSFAGETWLRLAELEFKTSPDNAVQYYLKYFEMFPRHPRISELQNRVGVIYLQQKKYDNAISMFRQALASMISQSKSERANITSNLYRALEEKGDSKSADSVHRLYNLNYSQEK
jgi:tetratricopeptide (TPR) repeat protein